MEYVLVVELHGHFCAPLGAEPAQRVKQSPDQIVLDVARQEILSEVLEGTLPVQAVIGGGEAPARDGTDGVDFIEQPSRLSVDDDSGVAQFLQNAIGQCSGPGAAARKGEEHNKLSTIIFLNVFDRVGLAG